MSFFGFVSNLKRPSSAHSALGIYTYGMFVFFLGYYSNWFNRSATPLIWVLCVAAAAAVLAKILLQVLARAA